MNMLALDLGTTTGYAVKIGDEPIVVGSWLLAMQYHVKLAAEKRLDRRCDPRVHCLFERIQSLHKIWPIEWVVFEDVQFVKSTAQAQLWSAYRGAVWHFASTTPGVRIECLNTTSLKRFATNHGGADKIDMANGLLQKRIEGARFRPASAYPPMTEVFDYLPYRATRKMKDHYIYDTLQNKPLDDNAVDAIHLLTWGLNNIHTSTP